MKKKLCNYPDCNRLIDIDQVYCSNHVSSNDSKVINSISIETKPFQRAKRSNEGYYNTTEWHKVSREVKKRDGYRCIYCGSKHRLESHHLIQGQLDWETFLNPEYIVTVCSKCHKKITQENINKNRKG